MPCQSARSPNADRRRNLLIGFTLAGSTAGAYSHLDWRSGVIVATAAPLVLAIAFIAMR